MKKASKLFKDGELPDRRIKAFDKILLGLLEKYDEQGVNVKTLAAYLKHCPIELSEAEEEFQIIAGVAIKRLAWYGICYETI